MTKAAVKPDKRAKPAKGKKHRRGVLDLPKAVETRMAEGRAERESVPLEAHAEWAAPEGRSLLCELHEYRMGPGQRDTRVRCMEETSMPSRIAREW